MLDQREYVLIPNSMLNHIRITFIDGLDISHTFRLHKGLPVMCDGLYVMCGGLPVMCEWSACHATAIMIHV